MTIRTGILYAILFGECKDHYAKRSINIDYFDEKLAIIEGQRWDRLEAAEALGTGQSVCCFVNPMFKGAPWRGKDRNNWVKECGDERLVKNRAHACSSCRSEDRKIRNAEEKEGKRRENLLTTILDPAGDDAGSLFRCWQEVPVTQAGRLADLVKSQSLKLEYEATVEKPKRKTTNKAHWDDDARDT